MRDLSIATASLARFQQLAFTEPCRQQHPPPPQPPSQAIPSLSTMGLRPASFPSPSPSTSPPFLQTVLNPDNTSYYSQNHKRYRVDEPEARNTSSARRNPSPSPSPSTGSDCCGGLLDCRELVDDDESNEPSPGLTRH